MTRSPSHLSLKIQKSISLSNSNGICILILIFICILFSLFSISLGIDASNDSLNYHLYNGYAFLTGRTFTDSAPAGMHSFLNPLIDAANFYFVTHLNLKLYVFINSFTQTLSIFPIYYIIKNTFQNIIKQKIIFVILSSISLVQSLFLTQLGTGMGDNINCLLVLLSFALLLPSNKKKYILAAFVAGLAVGLKLTAASYGIATIFVLAFYSFCEKNPKKFILGSLFLFIGFLGSNGWWMYELYKHFGNPFFPIYNNIFHSPYATLDKNALVDWYFFNEKKSLQETFFYPILFSINPGLASGYFGWPIHSFYREASAYILISITAFLCMSPNWRNERSQLINQSTISIFIFISVSYLVWINKFGVMRYIMPTLLLCPFLIVLFCFSIFIDNSYHKKKLAVYSTLTACLIFISYITVKDISNGFPSERALIGNRYFPDIAMDPKDQSADIYLLTGHPRLWEAWTIPALKLGGVAIPIAEGVFSFEGPALYKKRKDIIKNAITSQRTIVLLRDVTGEGWVSQYTPDEEVEDQLKRYGLKLLSKTQCRRYNSSVSLNQHIIEFCDVTAIDSH